MANKEHVDLLLKSVEEFNLQREEDPELLPDLRIAHLAGANLTDADLSRAGLDEANLSGANLTDASLSRASLIIANLSGANLTDANLTDAHLFKADLSGSDLRRADLRGADLSGANLKNVTFDAACVETLFAAGAISQDLCDALVKHIRSLVVD